MEIVVDHHVEWIAGQPGKTTAPGIARVGRARETQAALHKSKGACRSGILTSRGTRTARAVEHDPLEVLAGACH